MTNVEILTNFETEIGVIDNTLEKPLTDTSLYWLNQAVAKFSKLRFNGDFIHKTGFEETEKRREDLIHLFKSKDYKASDMLTYNDQPSYDQYTVIYPTDLMYVLNEDVIISDTNGGNRVNTYVFECTRDSFMNRVNNSLTDFHYRHHKARPLRIRFDNGCDLLTDKNYKVQTYTVGYLRFPKKISLETPFEEYPDFDDNTMYEIIKMAAQMYLENTSNERYKTISTEVATQE